MEEYYDAQQYKDALVEALVSQKTSMPSDKASTGRTVKINLRSNEWRDGVRKEVKTYLEKAKLLATGRFGMPLYWMDEVANVVESEDWPGDGWNEIDYKTYWEMTHIGGPEFVAEENLPTLASLKGIAPYVIILN